MDAETGVSHGADIGRVAALVCDLDGVIRHFDEARRARLEHEHGLPEGFIATIAFEPARLRNAITGRVADENWRASIVDALAEHLQRTVAEYVVAEWSRSPGELDQAVLDVVRTARRRVPVVLLTNATTRLPADLAELGALDEFDAVVSSAVTGHPKPEPGAYSAAEEAIYSRLGQRVTRSTILYFDDSQEYVDAAVSYGWRATQFTVLPDMRSRLVEAGLLT